MSGPKTSQYTLTPEQRAQLELQRRIRAELKLLDRQRMDARLILKDAEDLVRRTRAMSREDEKAETVSKILENLQVRLEDLTRMEESSGLQALQSAGEQFEKDCAQLRQQTELLKLHMQNLEQDFRKDTGKKITAGFRLDFSQLGGKSQNKTAVIRKQLEELLHSAKSLYLSDSLRRRLEETGAKAREITDVEFLKNYRSMSVEPLLKECQAYHELYEAEGAQFRCKLALYQENCRELDQSPREIPFGHGAMQTLDQLLHQTEAALAFRQEQAYISKCMDEAMEELGYSVLGHREVTKRSGQKYRNALYLFDEGTAVNVTFADNGQITMELGGLDRQDRLPTQQESRALVQEMDNFCVDFGKLEGILLRKGIRGRRISILPSHEQYAQIINVSDYELNRPISLFHAERGRGSAEKQKERKLGE